MPGVADVGIEFEKFLQSWTAERGNLPASVEVLGNGFEGWLKFEFYFWLIREHGLRATCAGEYGDIGVEYGVALDQRRASMDIREKRCDLWVSDLEGRYHFIEIKVPFANRNQGKMFNSASDDYWYMSRLRSQAEQVSTGSVIIVGVNFADERWDKHLERVAGAADAYRQTSHCGGRVPGSQSLHWAVLTTHYPQPVRDAVEETSL